MTDTPRGHTATYVILDEDDPADRIDIPTRLHLRRAGRDQALIVAKLVEDALAWFRCDPHELVFDIARARGQNTSDGAWFDVEATVTTVHDLEAHAATEVLAGHIYRDARNQHRPDVVLKLGGEITREQAAEIGRRVFKGGA